MMEKRLLTIEQASEYLGLSRATLYEWVSRRKIEHVRFAGSKGKGRIRFDVNRLDQWIVEHSVEAAG